MFSIWKYPLSPREIQDISMPEGAEILTVQNQNENICIWAKVDPNAPKVLRTFAVYGTGWDIVTNASMEYIGTVQLSRGEFVYHVFEWICRKEICPREVKA